LTFQAGETLVDWALCGEIWMGPFNKVEGRPGHLAVTNQRVLFFAVRAPFQGMFGGGTHELVSSVDLGNVAAVTEGKYGMRDKIAVLDRSGNRRIYQYYGLKRLVPVIRQQMAHQ
jgi:hypothetical protein